MTDNGVHAFETEAYKLPKEAEKYNQQSEESWWSNPVVIIFVTISMSVLDGLVLYDIMDRATTQSEVLGYILAYGIALILNMIPLATAKFTHQWLYNIKCNAKKWTILTIIAFTLLFSGTVALRIAYTDSYGETSTPVIVNQVDVSTDTSTIEEETNTKGVAVVFLLCIEPLATSLLNFLLAYMSDDELRKTIHGLRMRGIELKEAESDLRACIATIKSSNERHEELLKLDLERKEAAEALIYAKCDALKARARELLGEYLSDPEGACYATEAITEISKEA